MHYGHPDIFDKIYAIGNAGVSKANKRVHLNEDIFAGFNAVKFHSFVCLFIYLFIICNIIFDFYILIMIKLYRH